MTDTVIEIDRLHKRFGRQPALDGVSLQVRRGEMVALLGASGSGKSTLLRHLNGLHRADAGSHSAVTVLGRQVQQGGRLAPDLRAQRAQIATVFQQFNLVERLPVMLNVLAGALHRQPAWRTLLQRFPEAERQRALQALHEVGIAERAWQRASTLSGGQQQRAAIARALLQGAQVLLADEPIASLDPASAQRVMQLLARMNRERGVTVLVSLHQVEAARRHCPRTVALRAGRVVYDGPTAALDDSRLQDLYGDSATELLQPGEAACGAASDPASDTDPAANEPVTPALQAA